MSSRTPKCHPGLDPGSIIKYSDLFLTRRFFDEEIARTFHSLGQGVSVDR